jgi:hypothetical protein
MRAKDRSQKGRWPAVPDGAKIQQLVRQDRVLVCETMDLIKAISPRRKTRTGRRPYIVIVRDHHQLRIELHEA